MAAIERVLEGLAAVPLTVRQKCAFELLESAAQFRQRWMPFEEDKRVAGAVDLLAQQEHVCELLARLLTADLGER